MNRKDRRALAKKGDVTALASALQATAMQLERDGRAQEAEQKYREALACNSRLRGANASLAELLHEHGRTDEAIIYFNNEIRLGANTVALHIRVGRIHLDRGQLHEAGHHFQRASAIDPRSGDAHNGFGAVLYELGQLDDATKCYLHALDVDPGNLLARINLGTVYARQGRIVDALEQAEIVSRSSHDPAFPAYAVGGLLARCGAKEAALICFRAHLQRHPDDDEGARLWLAALGGAPMPDRASDRHLDRLYTSRASNWDEKALSENGYFGARMVAAMLARLSGGAEKIDIVDLGCGTGLVGDLVVDKARALIGVDASLPMLERARAKRRYQHLEHGDLIAFMRQRPDCCDAITCAATLIHFGDLRPAFEAAAACLRDQGLFVMTLFPNENEDEVSVIALDGWIQGGCFKHGRNYVRQLAESTGFVVEAIESDIHEYRKDEQVMGLVVALRRVKGAPKQASAA
jgi:predicted TPR repeat methyltransferase